MDLRRAHELLGATEDTPIEAVRNTYRVRARMMHPDKQHDAALKEEATKLFQELSNAWEVISQAEAQGSRQDCSQATSPPPDGLDDEWLDDEADEEYLSASTMATTPLSSVNWLPLVAGLCLVIMGFEAGFQGGVPYPDSFYPWIVVAPFATGIFLVVRAKGAADTSD